MGDTGLFIAGFLITIPALAGIVSLILAAIADGRENDRIQARIREQENAGIQAGGRSGDGMKE
ncbi:MAG: hypothetical protein FJW96_05340 [Actinobacteria bacterium]|nr:hypothetical protein [Actinomycetota bacterium]